MLKSLNSMELSGWEFVFRTGSEWGIVQLAMVDYWNYWRNLEDGFWIFWGILGL
jgi:hypothetical protein